MAPSPKFSALRNPPTFATALLLICAEIGIAACSGGSTSPAGDGDQGGSGSSASTGSQTSSGAGSGASGSGSGSGTGTSSGTGSGAGGSPDAGAQASFGGGYYTAGAWHGYEWTETSGTGTTVSPMDFSTVAAGQPLCASGSVAGLADYSGTASIGVNLNQTQGPNTPVGTVTPTLAGLTVSVTNTGGSPLRVQLEGPNGATDADQRWCYVLSGSGGFIPWASFNTECWSGAGTAYDGTSPLASVSVMVPGAASGSTAFDFCVNDVEQANAPSSAGGSGTSSGSSSGSSGTIVADAGALGGTGTITAQYGWEAVTRDGRNYIVQNNVWGGTSNQALSYDGTTFTVTQQNGSNPTDGAPLSYPSVFIGSNNGRSTAGDNLPKAVSALTTVPTTWTNNGGTPSGTYNAAYDVWFSTTSAGDSGSPSGGFLMLWFHKPSMAQPIGSVEYSAVTIPGATGTWDVWIGMNGAVPCISYVSTQGLTGMSYDLNEFIQDAVKNRPNTIQSGWYLTNVYAGFEIWSGGQGLETTSFSVVVN